MSKGTGIGQVILDVIVMDVSRIDVAIMGSDSVGAEVEADPFDLVEEGIAFRGVERKSPLGEDC